MPRILIVEDNPEWQALLQRVLTHAGYETDVAVNVDAALGKFDRKKQIGIVVFDLRLDPEVYDDPLRSLEGLIKRLIERRIKIPPIIIVTGIYVPKEKIIEAFVTYRGIVYHFFEKDTWHPEIFRKSVAKAMGWKGTHLIITPTTTSSLIVPSLIVAAFFVIVFLVLVRSVGIISSPEIQNAVFQAGTLIIIVLSVLTGMLSQRIDSKEALKFLRELIDRIAPK